jgi:small-conductance mechanosensitive channel
VFSFSLVVFSALVAVLLLRKLDELVEKARAWMRDRPDRLPSLSIREIEVVQAAALRGGLDVALTIGKRFVQVGVGYAWIVISLSLFESTRDYTQRLTGLVLTPLSALMARVAAALPVMIIAVITGLVVSGALRFVRLFFGSVARGETTLEWLPRDLAAPTSILVRGGIVLVTLVVSAPLLTGADDGALSRVGVVAVAAIGVAITPLLSNAAAGAALVFGRKLRVGIYVSVGGRSGWIKGVSLLEVMLEDEDGAEVHIPHLLTLWHPTSFFGAALPLAVEVSLARVADITTVVALLEEVAARIAEKPRVEVVSIGADGARLRVTVDAPKAGPRRVTKNRLFANIGRALDERSIGLGKGGP